MTKDSTVSKFGCMAFDARQTVRQLRRGLLAIPEAAASVLQRFQEPFPCMPRCKRGRRFPSSTKTMDGRADPSAKLRDRAAGIVHLFAFNISIRFAGLRNVWILNRHSRKSRNVSKTTMPPHKLEFSAA